MNTPTVSRKYFHDNPEKVVAKAIRVGRVVILNDQGIAVAAISVPTDRRAVSFD